TNAAKYGALSAISGRARVRWELTPSALVLHWEESNGPRTRKPARMGFGTRIIAASVEGQLGGEAAFQWHEGGLHCILTIPRGDKVEQPRAGASSAKAEDKNHAAVASKFVVAGNRIMVVEDEALVAMVECDALSDLGYEVAGPFSRPPEALAAVREGGVAA